MIRRPLTAVLTSIAAFFVFAAAAEAQTTAPDLESAGNFRPAPTAGNTLVDFSFDQAVYLNGGDRSNFHLVPPDAALPENGLSGAPAGDAAGDALVTVEFVGTFTTADFARGYVDSGVATSRQAGANSANPTNVNQAAAISGGGTTANPDLDSVTIDGDQVIFTFDEALTSDDVVQNNGGLRVYFPSTSQSSSIRDAGALAVKPVEGDPASLRAYYGNDLPEDFKLADAVGAFTPRDTVQAADDNGARDNKNSFDEIAPLQNSGAEVCAAPGPLASAQVGSGPTEAPDLLSVGNFRRGPFTSQFTPTTCVDFTFDQAAYLNNGDRSNFSLVPSSGGDALSGTTNVEVPEGTETPGDEIITVVFPGEIDPADFARGFVDTGVLSSEDGNASASAPYAVNQSADVSPNNTTQNPDLARVSFDGDSYLFEFDQALTNDDLIQNTSGLRLYFPETDSTSTIPFAASFKVEEVSPTTLRAFYRDLPENYELSDAVGAFAVQGTVQAVPGSGGGNDGANGFHEIQISGSSLDGELCDGLLATVPGVTGTPADDVIVGTEGNDTINGGGGDDTICGRGGADTLNGDGGEDALFGEKGGDTLDGGLGDDKLAGGNGDDLLLQPGNSPDGDDDLSGGQGNDTVDYSNRDAPVTATIGGTGGEQGETDQIRDDVENLIGGSADDKLIGDSGPNVLTGNDGDDVLKGKGGDDTLNGGDGKDDLRGGPGDDDINARDSDKAADKGVNCGKGNDSVDIDGDDAADGCENQSGPGGNGKVRDADITLDKKIRVKGKKLKVKVSAGCQETCTFTGSGTVVFSGGARAGLRTVTKTKGAGKRTILRLKPKGGARQVTRQIRKAIRGGAKARVRVVVDIDDRQGNSIKEKRVARLKVKGASTSDNGGSGDNGDDRRGNPDFTG